MSGRPPRDDNNNGMSGDIMLGEGGMAAVPMAVTYIPEEVPTTEVELFQQGINQVHK